MIGGPPDDQVIFDHVIALDPVPSWIKSTIISLSVVDDGLDAKVTVQSDVSVIPCDVPLAGLKLNDEPEFAV